MEFKAFRVRIMRMEHMEWTFYKIVRMNEHGAHTWSMECPFLILESIFH